MGTRSVIAIPQGDGWKGRYTHWDGYPTHMGKTLAALIAQHGVETVVKTLTEDNYGWSVVDNTHEHDDLSRGKEYCHPGWGDVLSDVKPDEWITNTSDDWGTEWCYVLLPNGNITVLRNAYKWVIAGTISHDHVPPQSELIALECGPKLEWCSHVEDYHGSGRDGLAKS